MSTIRNLVFEGGGVKGIAYIGFLSAFSAEIEKVRRVAGASAGALFALMLALDYSLSEIEKIYKDLDFKTFQDDDRGVIRDMSHLINEFGFYKGDVLFEFIKSLIKNKINKDNLTFQELNEIKNIKNKRELYVVSTKIFFNEKTPSYETVVFSHQNTPNSEIAYAVRASMAIPFYFTAVRLKKMSDGSYIRDDKEGDIFVDGGLTNNYPIRIFDNLKYVYNESDSQEYFYNESTLGVRLDSQFEIQNIHADIEEKARHSIKKFPDFVSGVLNAVFSVQNESLINSRDKIRSIFINCGSVTATDFDLDEKSQKVLIEAGLNATKKYLTEKQPQRLSEFKLFTPPKSDISSEKEKTLTVEEPEKIRSRCFCTIL